MLEHAVFGGCLLLPPKALTVVGILNFAEGSIALTGPQSERVVADWLGTPQLDQAELRESGIIVAGHELMSTGPISTTHLEPALLYALLERGGVEPDGEVGEPRMGAGRSQSATRSFGRSNESRGEAEPQGEGDRRESNPHCRDHNAKFYR
jgi:hypothetical protein